MSWIEIKHAVNSTVGTEDFKPLDKIFEEAMNRNGQVKEVEPDFSYSNPYYVDPDIGYFLTRVRIRGDGLIPSIIKKGQTVFGIEGSYNAFTPYDIAHGQVMGEILKEDWEGLRRISPYSFTSQQLTKVEIPSSVETVGNLAFWNNNTLTMVRFFGTPDAIAQDAFGSNDALLDIYVPWSEGEVANAPWGATNATIHYNTEV